MFLLTTTRLAQCLPAFTVYMLFLSCGIVMSWSSPMLPILKAKTSPIPVTNEEGSWIVSVLGLSGFLAPIMGFMLNRFGRKPILIAAAIPITINWIMTIFATSAAELIAARTIAGLSFCSIFLAGPVYIGEISQEDIRGILGGMMDLFYNLGFMFSYCIGPYVSFRIFSCLCSIPPVIFVLLMLFMPESPYYLLKKNERDEAQKALISLRWSSPESVKDELNKMDAMVQDQNKKKGSLRDLFFSRASQWGLFVTIGLVIIQQLSGTMVIISYIELIFDLTPGLFLSSSECAMIVGAMKLMSGCISVSLIDKVGRRPLLITSTLGCACSLCVLGVYLYLYEKKFDTSLFKWVPLFCLMVYELMYCLGLSSLPVLMLGEVFASNVKDFAVSLIIMTTAECFVIETKIYTIMTDSFGGYSAFWLFSAVALFGSVFVYFIVPETKGKHFETIIAELNEKSCIPCTRSRN